MQGPGLFRQEALQHQFTSLEDLEKPFQLLRIGAWLPLLGLGVLCGAGLIWAIFGQVPETVEGVGVLLHPGRVRQVETVVGGRIKELRVTQGTRVEKGDIVAVLETTETQKQLDLARDRLAELTRTNQTQTELEKLRLAQEAGLRAVQERSLDTSIQDLEQLLVQQEKRGEAAINEQREALQRSVTANRRLNESLREKAESARRLAGTNVINRDMLLQAESALTENNSQLSTLEVRLTELKLKETETKQTLVTQRTKLAELRVQRHQLDVRKTQLEQETTLAQATRKLQIQEQADRIKQLETTVREQGEVRSPYAGRVIEVGQWPGQGVSPGTALATIDLETSPGSGDPKLRNLAYFPIRTGKRIQVGMEVRVAPMSVQRERFGSIIGVVTHVSEYPVGSRTPAAAVGNPELARALLSPGGVIEVEVDLEAADTPSGFHWTSAGPPNRPTAGTTTRTTVTVEQRRPITYLLPILRSWLDGTQPPELPGARTPEPTQQP